MGKTPKIVCLCGSTRFMPAFTAAAHHETLAGNIVLSVGVNLHHINMNVIEDMSKAELKEMLDMLHLKKIEMSDEILVLNLAGYVGKSTAREILHAKNLGLPVRWLELHKSMTILELEAIAEGS